MKNQFILLFLLCIAFKSQCQTDCSEADSDIIYAYSDVKLSYESNNIDHLKYYANKSLDAFKRAKPKLKNCGCEASYNNAYDAAELLAKVEGVETFEDGRFYVKRARDLAKQSIIELDKCTALEQEQEEQAQLPEESNELSDLQQQQAKLKQQQEDLKRKEQEIKRKLAAQKEKELSSKKEEMINQYNKLVTVTTKNYNEVLKTYQCHHSVTSPTNNTNDLLSKDIDAIKTFYLNKLKALTKTYLSFLEDCGM